MVFSVVVRVRSSVMRDRAHSGNKSGVAALGSSSQGRGSRRFKVSNSFGASFIIRSLPGTRSLLSSSRAAPHSQDALARAPRTIPRPF